MAKIGPYMDLLRFKFSGFFNGEEGAVAEAPGKPMDVTAEQAREMLAKSPVGGLTLLDVRQDWEYQELRVPGATHVPLPELADRLGELDASKPILVYCKAGGRSAAAASLLAGRGFAPVYNMQGGIMAWSGAAAVGDKSRGLELFRPGADPAEVLRTAYGMELFLGRYYADMAAASADAETAATFARLAGFEDKHKNRVYSLYLRHAGAPASREELEASAEAGAPEGGLSPEEYLENVGGQPEEAAEVLELAMNIEAQAMDLYLRLADAVGEDQTKAVAVELAEEEKRHLKALAVLLDRLAPKV